ncbi:hypothetical protein WDU94_002056, partial [Cyamophila willieti]
QLKAYFSQHGVHGHIQIEQKPHQQAIEVDTTELYRKVDTWENQWHWSIHEFPVDYTNLEDRCGNDKLGSQLFDLDSIAGLLDLNDTKLIQLNNDQLQLTGSQGIWGSSILLENVVDSSIRACATLSVGGSGGIKLAEARFYAPVAGSIYFEWAGFSALNTTDALIMADLKRLSTNKFKTSSEHKWKIFVTNALEAEKGECVDDVGMDKEGLTGDSFLWPIKPMIRLIRIVVL